MKHRWFNMLAAISLLLFLSLATVSFQVSGHDYLTWLGISFVLPRGQGNVLLLRMAIGFLVLPMTWLIYRVSGSANKPEKSDICSKCGYDLRATPRRCPECGQFVNQR
jgi:hypothetical protein